VLEYTGSDVVIERVSCSSPLNKDLILEVLTVGNVYPPQVTNNTCSQLGQVFYAIIGEIYLFLV
jgi:hypothetical protein